MDTIPAEKKDLEVHVDLCSQRYAETRSELMKQRTILIVLLIEATISAASSFPTLLPTLRDLITRILA